MTFEEALGQIEIAVREHGATVEELVVRLRSGAISKEQFVAEVTPVVSENPIRSAIALKARLA